MDFADDDKKVKERVDAKNAFDNYLHSLKVAVEGSGDNKGLSEKLEDEEKEEINAAIKDGEEWFASNSEAEAEEIKEKYVFQMILNGSVLFWVPIQIFI